MMKLSMAISGMLPLVFASGVMAATISSTELQFRLSAYDQNEIVQDKHEPIRLELSLSNPSAFNASSEVTHAQELKNTYDKAGWQDVSPARRKVIEQTAAASSNIPVVSVGSTEQPIASLLTFPLTDSHNKVIHVAVRRLAMSENPKGTQNLDGKNSVHMQYGLDPQTLAQLPAGKYTMCAIIDGQSKPGSWQGHLQSDSVSLTLQDAAPKLPAMEQAQRYYDYGYFYIADKQYTKAEPYVKRLLALDPNSASAAQLEGDICFGQGKLKEAQDAFQLSLDRLRKKFGADSAYHRHDGQVLESPTYIEQRLAEVLRAKAKH